MTRDEMLFAIQAAREEARNDVRAVIDEIRRAALDENPGFAVLAAGIMHRLERRWDGTDPTGPKGE